jgi:hypothetical protein
MARKVVVSKQLAEELVELQQRAEQLGMRQSYWQACLALPINSR